MGVRGSQSIVCGGILYSVPILSVCLIFGLRTLRNMPLTRAQVAQMASLKALRTLEQGQTPLSPSTDPR